MNQVIVSLNNNKLKVSYIEKYKINTLETDVPGDVVSDTKVLNINEYSKILSDVIDRAVGKSRRKVKLAFVAHTQDLYLRFITVSKSQQDLESVVVEEIKSKFQDFDIENSFFSYHKIAPFVYQFIGVDKQYLANFLELSNLLQMEITGIYPWVVLLPKYLKINDPAIFVTKINNEQVVALSELNGIFYSGVFEEEKSSEELDKLVRQLSIYKRNQPISKIFTLNYDDLKIENGFDVFKIDIPNQELENAKGFELNLLVDYMIDLEKNLSSTYVNIINLLPLPVEVKRKVPMVLVGASVSAAALVLIVGGVLFYNNSNKVDSNAAPEPNQVLSSNNIETQLNNEAEINNTQPESKDEAGDPKNESELKKEELKIRIENGSGINGAAGSTKEIMDKLGYDVIEIDTSDSQRTDTLLKFKNGKSTYKDIVLEDLKDTLGESSVEEGLDDVEEYDLLIVLGSSANL